MNIDFETAQRLLRQMGYQCAELDILVEVTKGSGLPVGTFLEKTLASAQRWESFIRSARFRVLGSAGFTNALTGSRHHPGYRHMGLELWTHYDASEHIDNSHEVGMLENYADAMTKNLADPHFKIEVAKQA